MLGIPYIYIAMLLIFIWAIYRFINYKRIYNFNKRREYVITFFFLYFLAIVNYSFFDSGKLYLVINDRYNINFIPILLKVNIFKDNIMAFNDVFNSMRLSLIMFIPLGFFIPLLFCKENKLIKIARYGFISSICIELIQFFSRIYVADINDLIFNTLGAVVGFIIFNIFISLIQQTKLMHTINYITSEYKGNLAILGFKPIITMLIAASTLSIGLFFTMSASGTLTNDELAKEVFSDNLSGNYVDSSTFFNYRLFLFDTNDYLELQIADKVLTNRYTSGLSEKINLGDDQYGYSVMILDNADSKGIVVYGRNNDAKMIEITFNGKKYAEPLQGNTYFLVTFPTFEALRENSDILNIYSSGESKDLAVDFIDENGKECPHMKLIK